MARKKRGRNFVAIPFSHGLSLLALANNTAEAGPILTFGEDIYVISADVACHVRGLTAGEGEPLEFGFAHGDLSDIEVEECLGAEVTDPDDIIAKERARRPVRRCSMLIRHGNDDTALAHNSGASVRIKVAFSVGDSHSLNVWVANRSGASLTTGAVANFTGTLYGRWQR